jgi:hypothetical protein
MLASKHPLSILVEFLEERRRGVSRGGFDIGGYLFCYLISFLSCYVSARESIENLIRDMTYFLSTLYDKIDIKISIF